MRFCFKIYYSRKCIYSMLPNNILTNENVKLLDEIKKHNVFKSFNKKLLGRLIENSRIDTLPPHHIIWERGKKLDLTILVKGAVGISYGDEKGDSINSFSRPFELLGEFEWLGLISKARRLFTLSDSIILTPKKEDIQNLIKNNPEIFYKGITKSFVAKMYHKDELLFVLSNNSVKDRLRYLLGQFYSLWRDLTLEIANNDNSYEIDIYWSDINLTTILSTSFRLLRKYLAELVGENLIEVTLCDEKYEPLNTDDLKDGKLSEKYINTKFVKKRGNYIRIVILDYNGLMNTKIQVKEKTKN